MIKQWDPEFDACAHLFANDKFVSRFTRIISDSFVLPAHVANLRSRLPP